MTPNAPAHAREGVLDLAAVFDADLPVPAPTDELAVYAQELADEQARPTEWTEAYAGPIEALRDEAEAERLTPEEAAVWLSELRDRRRANGLRVGGKSLAFAFRERWGYPIYPGNEGRCVTLATRGDLLRVQAGVRKTDEEIFAETVRDLDIARELAAKAGYLAQDKEQPKAMTDAADVLRVTAMDKAKLYGQIRQVQKTDSKLHVSGEVEHTHTASPALTAALDVAQALSADRRQSIESHRVAELPAGSHPDEDIVDAELEDES